MSFRRKPSQQFIRRLTAHREAKPEPTKPMAKLNRWIRKFHKSNGWLWGEFAALAFVIPTAIVLLVDLKDRKTHRIAEAWQLVTQVSPGNSGKGPALEYLNSQGISLTGIDLSAEDDQAGVFLREVNLSGADLFKANLSGVDLTGAYLAESSLIQANLSGVVLTIANLSSAVLQEADLSGADLSGADLSDTYLWAADLSGANLSYADLSEARLLDVNLSGANFLRANLSRAVLSGANLSEANFRGANLSRAFALDQVQLDNACGDEYTKLPAGFTIKACTE